MKIKLDLCNLGNLSEASKYHVAKDKEEKKFSEKHEMCGYGSVIFPSTSTSDNAGLGSNLSLFPNSACQSGTTARIFP